jgi:hypothetical protein
MMDRLRSPMQTLGVTAFLICVLSLAGPGMSHARPSHASQSVHSNGLPCNAVCKAYMSWSHRVTAMLHPSRPLKKTAAHHGRPPRTMVARHAPRTRQRSLNSFAQWPAQSDAPPQSAETPRAAEMPQAAQTPQATETPQAADADMRQAAETPRAAETPQAAETPPAAETPQAEVAPSRPIDRIADRFPTAAEFMTAKRAGTDSVTHDTVESTVVALESRVAALADTTPATQAAGAAEARAHGADMRLVASLLLALCGLAGLRIWRWFRARRDADRERILTFDQAIARARPKLRLVGVATELGPGA